jgi:hypothetical protein
MSYRSRAKDWNWGVLNDQGECRSVDYAILAVLMDLRDELKELNRLCRGTLGCRNFQAVPHRLLRIARAIDPPKARKGAAK